MYMTVITETGYSYISDHLFVNFLNTINGANSQVTDLLMQESGTDKWLELMYSRELLNSEQFRKLKEETFDDGAIRDFRNRGREYVLEGKHTEFISSLTGNVKQAPLYFDKHLNPVPSCGGSRGLLSLLSYKMLEAYQGNIFSKIKKCHSPACYALFVDYSGRRKWCSMEICGNRTKARKHYAKKKE